MSTIEKLANLQAALLFQNASQASGSVSSLANQHPGCPDMQLTRHQACCTTCYEYSDTLAPLQADMPRHMASAARRLPFLCNQLCRTAMPPPWASAGPTTRFSSRLNLFNTRVAARQGVCRGFVCTATALGRTRTQQAPSRAPEQRVAGMGPASSGLQHAGIVTASQRGTSRAHEQQAADVRTPSGFEHAGTALIAPVDNNILSGRERGAPSAVAADLRSDSADGTLHMPLASKPAAQQQFISTCVGSPQAPAASPSASSNEAAARRNSGAAALRGMVAQDLAQQPGSRSRELGSAASAEGGLLGEAGASVAHGTAEPRSSVRPGSSEACSTASGGGAVEAAAHPRAALHDAEQPTSSRACSAASHKGAELFAAPVAAELTDAGQRDVREDSGRVGNAGVSTAAPAAAQGTYISGLRIRSVLQLTSGKVVAQQSILICGLHWEMG